MKNGQQLRMTAGLFTAVLSLVLLVCVFGCATNHASDQSPAEVPAELAVTGPVVGRVHARGYQVYTCQQDGAALVWKLKAPDATFAGDFKGTHYAGPTW